MGAAGGIIGRAMLKVYGVMHRQYPPLDDRLRALFLFALLLTCQVEIFTVIPAQVRHCPPDFFMPPGVLAWLPDTLMDPAWLGKLLWAGRVPLLIVWVMAVIGLGGRTPLVLTAIGFVVYYSISKCCTGTGHGLHLPMYTLIVLALYVRPGRFSADALIARLWPAYPLRPGSSVDMTGAARTLVLVLAVYTLFAGGVSKMWVGGIGWMDGLTLQEYLKWQNHPKGELGRWMLQFVLDHRWLAILLSVWTVALELGSILAIPFRRYRNLVFLNACAFHIGIYLLMFPRYFPQMACYVIVMHWGLLLRGLPGGDAVQPSVRPVDPGTIPMGRRVRTVLLMVAISVPLIVSILVQKEWFPFTHIPMYNQRCTSTQWGPARVEDLRTEEGLVRLSREFDKEPHGQLLLMAFPAQVEVRVVPLGSGPNAPGRDMTDVASRELGNPFLWRTRFGHAVLREMHRYQVRADSLVINDPGSRITACARASMHLLTAGKAIGAAEEVRLVLHLAEGREIQLARAVQPPPAGADHAPR